MTSQQGSENAIIDQIIISVSPTSSPENIHVYTHTHYQGSRLIEPTHYQGSRRETLANVVPRHIVQYLLLIIPSWPNIIRCGRA
jgi:hypothetical protein